MDHYKAYLFVVVGILAVLFNSLLCLTVLDEFSYREVKKLKPDEKTEPDETSFCVDKLGLLATCNPYLSPYLLIKLQTQVLCMFLFVLFKKPKDCFLCYSKATNIKYSIF